MQNNDDDSLMKKVEKEADLLAQRIMVKVQGK
jgi:hypothetical protein